MLKAILLTIAISFLLLPISSHSQENARVRITLNDVPIREQIETQICVAWGAQMPIVPASYLHCEYYTRDAGNTGTKAKYRTSTREVDSKVTSYFVYGGIRLVSSRDIIRVIPVKYFDTGNKALVQQEIEITTRKNINEAFLDSYPLEFNRDRGFLNSENIWPTLRAFRLLLDYTAKTDTKVTVDVWNRLYRFFQSNSGFFKKGGSTELTEVLNYLETLTESSRREGEASLYAEFLNELVTIRGIEIGNDEDLTDYLHGQLMHLYETRLEECFVTADLSLQKFHEIGEYEKSLKLGTIILKSINGQLLKNVINHARKNLFHILLQCTISGQDYYQNCSNIPNANRWNAADGAGFLAQSTIGNPMMSEYLRVCDLMVSNGALSLRNTGKASEILKFYIEYNCALQGGL